MGGDENVRKAYKGLVYIWKHLQVEGTTARVEKGVAVYFFWKVHIRNIWWNKKKLKQKRVSLPNGFIRQPSQSNNAALAAATQHRHRSTIIHLTARFGIIKKLPLTSAYNPQCPLNLYIHSNMPRHIGTKL